MLLYFECPNGHRLKAKISHSGRPSVCPRCQAPIVVPRRAPAPVTDSSIVRLLSEIDFEHEVETAGAAEASAQAEAPRDCPRCKAGIPASARSCPQCGLYITVNADAYSRALKTAARHDRKRRRA